MKMNYVAYDREGQSATDTIEAAGPEEATRMLRAKGLYVEKITDAAEAPATMARHRGAVFGRGQRMKNLSHFTRQFYMLTATGTPIIDALLALEQQMGDTALRKVIAELRMRVEEGSPLSSAMQAHPEYFDPIYTNLIAAGEASGKLSIILEQLSNMTQKQVHIRSNLLGALLYPCVLTGIAVTVMVLMLTVVVPRFTDMFKMLDADLPASTRVVVLIGNNIRHYWWLWSGATMGIVVAAFITLRTEGGHHAWDRLVVRLPLFGKIVRSIATARIARFLGILLDSRLPLLDSLRLVRDATSNVEYSALIRRAEEAVVRGEAISSGFSDTLLVTPSVYHALRSGEASGRIAPSLIQVADFLDEENDVVMRSMGSIVEPIILVGLGLLVGGVSLSMFTPLFDLTAVAGGAG